ncbi:DUF3298 domain-containing protein [Rasiella sp. SM2506]|uniref:DUF3298 and DUF4163 domain-containing protein n=1 Tax=Rasiella sp. SM2506 TaxID=3423914 RepID=UPI003D7AF456
MNNKLYFLLIALVVFTTSCRKALETQSITKDSETLAECKNVSCPSIDIEYFTVNGNAGASEKINAEITNFIIQSLYVGEDENGSDAPTIERAMQDFIQLYRTHSAEFPGLSAEYFAEITVLQNFNTKELLSVSCRNYLYTGGAHGYGSVVYKNFDPKSGAQLYYEDVFRDVSAFEALAEKLFKRQNEIPESDAINSTGFWFEEDAFYLPETFGISKEFVTLYYNQYEIASYAAGPIEVEIPISEVKEMLKISVE